MTIYFSNPGTIDLRLLSTFGVNVKPNSSNPIGHFGTGLKYAIAGVLRLGGTVQVHCGHSTHNFFTKEVNYRGKLVPMVHMQEEEERPDDTYISVSVLPFSTSLGAHWEPWMLYREFRSNALDEGGPLPSTTYPSGADVVFCVQCPEVEAVLPLDSNYFLSSEPLARIGDVEIHPGSGPNIYYKGVKVYSHNGKMLHTYNFLSGLHLTEDRTVPEWSIRMAMAQALFSTTEEPAHYVKNILEAQTSLEASLDLNISYATPTQAFRKIMVSCYRGRHTNPTAVSWAKGNMLAELGFATLPVHPEEHLAAIQAYSLVCDAYNLTAAQWEPLYFLSEEVGEWNGYGMAVHNKAIYIHPKTVADPFLCFRAFLEAYQWHWLEDSSYANEKLIWKLLGQEGPTPAEVQAHPEALTDGVPF